MKPIVSLWTYIHPGRRNRIGCGFTLAALFAWLWLTTPAGGATAPSHCRPPEQIVFSCQLDQSAKVVSICRNETHLSYRYGRLDQIELAYPSEPDQFDRAFQYHRYTRPQVTYLRLCFKRESYRYVIGSDFDHGEQWAGLEVLRDGERLLRRPCQGPIMDHLMSLEALFPEALENECTP